VSEENILITTSGQQGLDLAGRLFINPGDVLLLDRPTLCRGHRGLSDAKTGFAGVDLEPDGSNLADMEGIIKAYGHINQKPKFIYVVPDFQNPSGISMSLKKRMELLELSRKYDIPIIEDSPYRGLYYTGKIEPSLYSLDQQQGGGQVIGLYTFSKLFCPGMRVGFNIGPPEVIAKMTCIKEGSTLNTPRYNQDICTAFLNEMDWPGHLERCRDYYRDKLQVFLNALEENFPPEMGVSWTKPEGGLFCWLSLPEGMDANELFYDAIKYKVAFVPGDAFFGENPDTNRMRLNFSYPSREQLAEAAKRLALCVKNRLAQK
jgi:2-aminoadipate transaminase